MRVTIVGGGNIGTQFAVHCAEAGHEVVILTSTPDLFDGHLTIVDETGMPTHEGDIAEATSNPVSALSSCDLVFVTVPATLMERTAALILEYAPRSVIVGAVPGNGGSECAFKGCIERGDTFFAIERVPAIARLVRRGSVVRSTGYREELHLAAIPAKAAADCAALVSEIFRMPCRVRACMLSLTLTPSNPILHTARLHSLFGGWRKGIVYERVPLFYEEWSDEASELLFAMDDELQHIYRALPDLGLDEVVSLRKHYEAYTVEGMTKKIRSITAFKGLKTPTVVVSGGVVPDFGSRYFTSDFPYGLSLVEQIARMAGVRVPIINRVMAWYRFIATTDAEFDYRSYGITDTGTLRGFYSR